jgi:hypothetical protein
VSRPIRSSGKKGRSVAEALAIARQLIGTDPGFVQANPQLAVDLARLGYVDDEAMKVALTAALHEVTPDDHREPSQPHRNPGFPFQWKSVFFNNQAMYLKFKLEGTRKKPVLWMWSCHEQHFGRHDED